MYPGMSLISKAEEMLQYNTQLHPQSIHALPFHTAVALLGEKY